MATTSLKLSDSLKKRTAQAAKRMGISTHAFMVEAIEKAASGVESQSEFIARGLANGARAKRTGKYVSADRVLAGLERQLKAAR
jgi:predicted transcriptional regulator